DREVPRESLQGLVFLPVRHIAQEGKVRGLLFELDPKQPNNVLVTLLDKPSQSGQSLMTQSLSVSGKNLWKRFEFNPQHVVCAIDQSDKDETPPSPGGMAKMSYVLEISAPVFNEPAVTSDLKGAAAKSSPFISLILKKADALERGDFGTVKKMSTEAAN